MDWVVSHDAWGTGTVHVGFKDRTCRICPSRPLCTRAKKAPRELTLQRAGRQEAISAARERQDTPEWRALYGARAGIEDCLVTGRARLRAAPLALCRTCQNPLAAQLNRSRPERRAGQRLGAGRSTRSHTDFTPSPPHGCLKRAAREFANGISSGTENLHEVIWVCLASQQTPV